MSALVRYDCVGDVAVLLLDDPATLNAMSADMAEALLAALSRAEREARAIVLGSIGRAFCSGASLTGGGISGDKDVGDRLERTFNPIATRMRASPLPIVSAVRGAAAGIGCAYALTGDIVVAGASAYFFQAFRQIGLVPDGGSTYLLARAIGRTRAMDMMLLGTKVTAETALAWGLVNRVVADDEVDAAALTIATELAAGPASTAMIKRLAWAGLDSDYATALSDERFAQREAGRTEDFAEGVASFREKRKAAFTGR